MPLSDEVRSLLLKYIAGEANKEEIELIEEQLRSDPVIFKEFEQLWDLWYAVGTATNVFKFNVDSGWNTMLQKIRGKEEDGKKHYSVKKILVWSGSIAAVILLFLSFVWFQRDVIKSEKINQQENLSFDMSFHSLSETGEDVVGVSNTQVKTLPGKRKHVQLPDGSDVWLDGNTSIHFMMSDTGGYRTLYLVGQAFFDITHQQNMPFVVKTEHATIKVLGTRFNVEAYPGDSTIETTLTSGRILLTSEVGDGTVLRQIKPGQKASVNYLSGRLDIQRVDTTFYTSWKDGKLIFTDESFGEVAKAMEHKYNVTISFENPSLMNKKLNGYFDKENLNEALTALKLTLQFQYSITGSHVIISK